LLPALISGDLTFPIPVTAPLGGSSARAIEVQPISPVMLAKGSHQGEAIRPDSPSSARSEASRNVFDQVFADVDTLFTDVPPVELLR
jgi:hypothetical protein